MADGNGNGNGAYRTFSGPGFGTLAGMRVAAPEATADHADADGPPVVSARATLRRGLPAIYQDNDFAMRFVGALEQVLDPIAATLDGLPAVFSPDHATEPAIAMLAAWLGAESDEGQALDERRESVRMAGELSRRRGTVAGLELALRLAFPSVPVRVEDTGGVTWSIEETMPEVPPARFIVYVDTPLPAERQVAVARCIERHKPVEATYRLRVKQPKAS